MIVTVPPASRVISVRAASISPVRSPPVTRLLTRSSDPLPVEIARVVVLRLCALSVLVTSDVGSEQRGIVGIDLDPAGARSATGKKRQRQNQQAGVETEPHIQILIPERCLQRPEPQQNRLRSIPKRKARRI